VDEIAPPNRWRARAGAVVVLVLVALGCAVLVSALTSPGSTTQVERSEPTGDPVQSGTILVHILGAVQRPGLYELNAGARAVDVVAAAGGFLDTADQAQLNLARPVVDGEQIVVPVIGAVPAGPPGTAADGKVNLNTADAATLETLPRVGPALAARIIAWRETNGRFATVDDLQSVSGIGDAIFGELRDLVTV
jgi:competence protein ComEA